MSRELARENMINQQVRASGVLDADVLQLLQRVPREQFVPENYRDVAFADTALPLGHGQTMLPPAEQGLIIQALKVQHTEIVLEVGTGSGYLTALLARLAKHVYSVDVVSEMVTVATRNIERLALNNVTLEQGNAAEGWPKYAPYDVIVVTGSLPELNKPLLEQLNVGGRLFAVVGKTPSMEALLVERIATDDWRTSVLFETVVPPLDGVVAKPVFEF